MLVRVGKMNPMPEKSNKTLWLGAKVVADFFMKIQGVKAVGLFGSLVRNQLAADADLIVFNDSIYKRFLGETKYPTVHLEYLPDVVRLGLTVAETETLMVIAKYFHGFSVGHFFAQPLTFDVVVFPEEYSVQFAKEVVKSQRPQIFGKCCKRHSFLGSSNTGFPERE